AAEAVARHAHLPVEKVQRVLDLFSTDMVARDVGDSIEEFLDGASPFRTNPLLRDPTTGDCVLVHQGLLVPSIREPVERTLEAANRWDRYGKRRGTYLEGAALALLEPLFPGCAVHRSFEYFVPDPRSAMPEAVPTEYTKLVEGDGLLVIDDVAVIVEAKAGAL